MKKSLIAFVGCSLLMSTVSLDAFNQKVVTVDLGKVFEKYEVAKKARDVYNQELEAADKELQTVYNEAVKLNEEIQDLSTKANNSALTDSARQKFSEEAAKKSEVLKEKEATFTKMRQEVTNKFNERRQKEVGEQAKVIEGVIGEVAKNKKADIVLNKASCILFVEDEFDMTELIINNLNAKK